MEPITNEKRPPAGTILSLTVRRGAVDPRTGIRCLEPVCLRATVYTSTEPNQLHLRINYESFFVGVEAFNAEWRPHVVAVYGPPEAAK